MDHAAWLARLREFVATWQARLPPERRSECHVQIDPPLSAEQVELLRDGLDCPLSPSIESFLLRAASRLKVWCVCVLPDDSEIVIGWELFNYGFYSADERPHGDPFVGPLKGMADARDTTRAIAGHLGDEENVLDRALWYHALPLTITPSNDALALWAYDPGLAEPPVIYLNHDDESFLLSRSFDVFLGQVEQLGYDFGEEYCDPESGIRMMDVDSPAAVARRELFGAG